MNDRGTDLPKQLATALAGFEQGQSIDHDPVWEGARELETALGDGAALEEAEGEIVGAETDGFEVVRRRFVFDGHDDILESLEQIFGNLVEHLLDERFELV